MIQRMFGDILLVIILLIMAWKIDRNSQRIGKIEREVAELRSVHHEGEIDAG